MIAQLNILNNSQQFIQSIQHVLKQLCQGLHDETILQCALPLSPSPPLLGSISSISGTTAAGSDSSTSTPPAVVPVADEARLKVITSLSHDLIYNLNQLFQQLNHGHMELVKLTSYTSSASSSVSTSINTSAGSAGHALESESNGTSSVTPSDDKIMKDVLKILQLFDKMLTLKHDFILEDQQPESRLAQRLCLTESCHTHSTALVAQLAKLKQLTVQAIQASQALHTSLGSSGHRDEPGGSARRRLPLGSILCDQLLKTTQQQNQQDFFQFLQNFQNNLIELSDGFAAQSKAFSEVWPNSGPASAWRSTRRVLASSWTQLARLCGEWGSAMELSLTQSIREQEHKLQRDRNLRSLGLENKQRDLFEKGFDEKNLVVQAKVIGYLGRLRQLPLQTVLSEHEESAAYGHVTTASRREESNKSNCSGDGVALVGQTPSSGGERCENKMCVELEQNFKSLQLQYEHVCTQLTRAQQGRFELNTSSHGTTSKTDETELSPDDQDHSEDLEEAVENGLFGPLEPELEVSIYSDPAHGCAKQLDKLDKILKPRRSLFKSDWSDISKSQLSQMFQSVKNENEKLKENLRESKIHYEQCVNDLTEHVCVLTEQLACLDARVNGGHVSSSHEPSTSCSSESMYLTPSD